MKKLAAKIEALADTLPEADFTGKRITVSEGKMKVTFDATRPAALALVKRLKKRRAARRKTIPHKSHRCVGGPWDGEYLNLSNQGQTSTAILNIGGQIGQYKILNEKLVWRTA